MTKRHITLKAKIEMGLASSLEKYELWLIEGKNIKEIA